MYKVIIAFIVAVLIIAIGMGQCNNDESDVDSDYNTEQTTEPTNYSESVTENRTEEQTPERSLEPERESELPEGIPEVDYSTTVYETPRMLKSAPDQILVRKSFSLSYNSGTKCPNWVAWHLIDEHTDGPISRRGFTYVADNEINGPKQEEEDWDAQNPRIWDHGHMCPAGDNKWDVTAMGETFLLSNFCPQDPRLNSGAWNVLEEKCRNWARRYKDIYIACGPIFTDTLNPRKINNKIWIPDALYKVVLCMNGNPKAIGFIYPNEDTRKHLRNFAVSVDSVEVITGIDFFYNLPDDIETEVESTFNLSNW